MSYGTYPPPPDRPEKIDPAKAGNAFLQGFAGCLGIGLALAVVMILLVVGCAVLAAHGQH
jgi:hypothetical protein